MATHKVIAGDTTTKLVVTCKDLATSLPIDLTALEARVFWRIDGGTTVNKLMSITNPGGGIAEYVFVTGDLVEGFMDGEIEIKNPGASTINISLKFNLDVEPRVSGT